MRIFKAVTAMFASLVLAVSMCAAGASSPKGVQPPKGFDKKVYDASLALYATSEQADIQNRFICTVTAFEKTKGGYLLIGAGHCTSANPDLPADLTYGVADDINGTVHPIILIKSEMAEPLDYAIYYYPTTQKYPTIELGDESKDRVGDKTIDVNYSLGAAKMASPGVIVSQTINNGGEVTGFVLVDEFASHGSSGSAVVSRKTHKIIGLVIAGWDGATMPQLIEPITSIEKILSSMTVSIASKPGTKTSVNAIILK